LIPTRLIVSLLLKRRHKGFLSRLPIPNSSRMTSRSFPPETNPPSHVVQWDRGLIETYKISPHERFAVKSGPHFTAIITSKHGRCAMAMLGWIALGTFLVFGQGSTGTLSGIARDATGAVVPEVSIEARHIESGLTRRVETNGGGDFKMPFMPVGSYEVTTEKLGFTKQVRRGITLAVGEEAILNLTMEVGSLGQRVTVTAETPIVNTTVSPASGLITAAQIKDMPLNGRSFEQLLTLNAGAVNNNAHSAWS